LAEPPTRVQLCGTLAVEVGGQRVEAAFPGRQGRLLFAYLAVNRQRSVSRDELADAVWGERLAAGADAALTVLLSKTRTALRPADVHGRGELRLTLPPDAWIDVVSAVFMVVGALMSLAAAIGLLRFPDLMTRMHAATKPQVLGLFLLLAAIGLQLRTWWVWPVLLVAWIFQLLTVPVSAHMVGRAGYRTKHLHRELLTADELEAVVQKAAAEAARKDNPDGGR